jgi:hypothetical protein
MVATTIWRLPGMSAKSGLNSFHDGLGNAARSGLTQDRIKRNT